MLLSPVDLGESRAAPHGEQRYRCPLCGDEKYKLYANVTKGVWHCFRCGAAGRLDAGPPDLPRRGQPPVVHLQERRASARTLDAAYRRLLDALPLDGRHLLHLTLVRRMTPGQVAALRYRTMPFGCCGRMAAAAAVARTLDPAGVPGFWHTSTGDWMLAGKPGLLIPVRHWDGAIRGLQIRREFGDPRYIWLTSRGRPGGTPAKAAYHVSWTPGLSSRRVWLTEGPLKADIAASRLGAVFAAVPGVQTWRGTGVVKDLRWVGVREVILAYDADQQVNPHVRRAAANLARAIKAAGLRVWVAQWSHEAAKGIDDLLLAGEEPRIVPVSRWLVAAQCTSIRDQAVRAVRTPAPAPEPPAKGRCFFV